MSAYVVDRIYIDAIVDLAIYGTKDTRWRNPLRWFARRPRRTEDSYETLRDCCRELRPGDHDTASRIGQVLIDENVKSVRYRYSETGDDIPGPNTPYWNEPYEYQMRFPRKRLSIARALGLLAFYDYQACEHPEYADSEARQFIESLQQELIRHLPEYGWPEVEEVV